MLKDDALEIAAYAYFRSDGKISIKGFSGRRLKPDFWFSFGSDEQATKYLAAWHEKKKAIHARKQERKIERAAIMAQPHKLKVGDVLVSIWGYEQTNVDYYQVVQLAGKRTVVIRKIAAKACEILDAGCNTGSMTGYSVPRKDVFTGKEMRRRVAEDGERVSM